MAYFARRVRWHALQRHLQRPALFEVEDATFSDAGMVGLWTKADSVTAFNAFAYGEKK
jgi:hypothetical protein